MKKLFFLLTTILLAGGIFADHSSETLAPKKAHKAVKKTNKASKPEKGSTSAKFKKMDKNKNGSISKKEFEQYFAAKKKMKLNKKKVKFSKIDRNKDKKISKKEWNAHYTKKFIKKDKNRDGFLSQKEFFKRKR